MVQLKTSAVPASGCSCHDNFVYPQETGSRLEGATNVAISGVSHLGMAFSPYVLGKLLEALEAT